LEAWNHIVSRILLTLCQLRLKFFTSLVVIRVEMLAKKKDLQWNNKKFFVLLCTLNN
jgi:hypothetical protein